MGIPLWPLALASFLLARLSLGGVGLVIFWRRSDDWVALMVSGALLSVLLEGSHPDGQALGMLQRLFFAVGTALFIPIPFTFPNGRFTPSWLRLPALAITAAFVAAVVVLYESPQYPAATTVLVIAWSGLALYAMPYRYRRVSTPVERQQIKWVLLGIGVTFLTATYYAVFNVLAPPTAPSPARVLGLLVNALIYPAGYGFFAATLFVAMLRYRLWDVDLIVRRTLQYSLLSALLVLTYFGGIVLLQPLLSPAIGARSPLAIVLSTLGVAALFSPMRRRVQTLIDRRFYRRKYEAAQVLAHFARTARDEVDLARLEVALRRVVVDTMQPAGASVWLKERANP